MKNVCSNITNCVGATPSVKLNRIPLEFNANLHCKLEFMNPSGSAKDRLALMVIEEAEKSGRLPPGGTIVDVTSGSMGVGLAMAAATRGYKTIFVIPDKQSEEKRAVLRAFGARVVITPTNVEPNDRRSAQSVARRLVEETPDSFFADQYHTALNPQAHYATTGPEIWHQFGGEVDAFVCGIGTGGTITGVGRYLKEMKPDVKIIGVDPVGSIYYDYFHTGQLTIPNTYMVEGIGSTFLPDALDFRFVDDVFRVNDKESFQMTRRLVREEGLFVGGSSGAAVAGALKFLRHNDRPGMNIVALLPDSGAGYLSKIFNDTWMRENGFLDPDSRLGTVRDLLAEMGLQDLIVTEADARVPEVIGILKLHGISQVPVVNDGRLVGILTENRLLERALRGGSPSTRAGDLAEANYCTIDKDTELTVVLELFRRARVAVVLDSGKPVNIITRIDIIDFISQSAHPHREP